MKRILITGANSYIGTSFEKWIKQYPNDYIVDTVGTMNNEWKEKDFIGYDVILHVAAIVHQKEKPEMKKLYFEVNKDLPIDVAKKAKKSGVSQFIFMSTMAVYGDVGNIKDNVIIDYNTSANPNTFYGVSKLEAEIELNKLCDDKFKIVVIRPPMVYGPNCPGNYSRLERIAVNSPVFPMIKNKRSMLYIDKLCQYIREYINNDSEGLFLPQDDEYVNTSIMVKKIAEINGKSIYLSKMLGWLLKTIGTRSKLINKVFGNLTYIKLDKKVISLEKQYENKTKYSVLMSVYYKEKPEYLRDSIISMLNQSIRPDEIVLVKDGPLTQDLEDVVMEFCDCEILNVIELKENVGLGQALNIGLRACKNDIVARMDTDDISDRFRCEIQLKRFEDSSISVVGSSVAEFIDKADNVVAHKSVFENHNKIVHRMKYRNPINHPTVMFKKRDVESAGSYQDWFLNEDYYLWIRMLEKGFKFVNINIPLVKMRITNETYMRRGGWKYFITQKHLFDYMLKNNIISLSEYLYNNVVRFVARVLVPNRVRKFIYLHFLRE